MKILVTGANGYIGSKVVKKLCDLNVVVIATDFDNKNIDNRAIFKQANIFSDNDNWFNYFDNPDVCLHLAWEQCMKLGIGKVKLMKIPLAILYHNME